MENDCQTQNLYKMFDKIRIQYTFDISIDDLNKHRRKITLAQILYMIITVFVILYNLVRTLGRTVHKIMKNIN